MNSENTIQGRRAALGWTRRRLSEMSGISERTIWRCEHLGERRTSPAVLTCLNIALSEGVAARREATHDPATPYDPTRPGESWEYDDWPGYDADDIPEATQ